jgi:hypothetical protein
MDGVADAREVELGARFVQAGDGRNEIILRL